MSPEELAIQQSHLLRTLANRLWFEGCYKVFPTELQGDDRASILRVNSNTIGKDLTYCRYVFKKIGGKSSFKSTRRFPSVARWTCAKYAWDKKPEPDWVDAGPKDLMPHKAVEEAKPSFSVTPEQLA